MGISLLGVNKKAEEARRKKVEEFLAEYRILAQKYNLDIMPVLQVVDVQPKIEEVKK